ncbi:MAG: hypothetical protein ABIA63_04595 [bacterium]
MPVLWIFEKLDTLRWNLIQRAGRLTKPQNILTLTMGPNRQVKKEITEYPHALRKAA